MCCVIHMYTIHPLTLLDFPKDTLTYLIFVTVTTGDALRRKICHVEKFFLQNRFFMWRNMEKNLSYGDIFSHERCGDKSAFFLHKSRCFVVKSLLLPFTLFCCERCFVAIYALLCGEKLNQKLCLWRKKDKYHSHHNTNYSTKKQPYLLSTSVIIAPNT